MRVWTWSILLACTVLQAREFLYPVGFDPVEHVHYVLYQKTSTHIELWKWDFNTQNASQVLLSRYTPASFTLLPNSSGFSFIDNGALKVKQLLKRSPRTIDYDAPIQNIERVSWIDEKSCYTSAKYQDYFGIFQIDWDGCVSPVRYSKGVDVLYPQKINNDLFYIERSKEGYRIAASHFIEPFEDLEFRDRYAAYKRHEQNEQHIISFGHNPIVFLDMKTADEGFVLSHPESLSKKDEFVPFGYHRVYFQDGEWHQSLLFTFNIPMDLLFGSERLYESILPLLPKACQGRVYYVDSDQVLTLRCYDMRTATSSTIAKQAGHIFGINKVEEFLIYGGQLSGDVSMVEGVKMNFGTLALNLT